MHSKVIPSWKSIKEGHTHTYIHTHDIHTWRTIVHDGINYVVNKNGDKNPPPDTHPWRIIVRWTKAIIHSISLNQRSDQRSLTGDHWAIRPLITLTDHRGEVSIENIPRRIDVVIGEGEVIVVDFKHCSMEGAIKWTLRWERVWRWGLGRGWVGVGGE